MRLEGQTSTPFILPCYESYLSVVTLPPPPFSQVHLRIMSCMVLRGRDINFPAVGDETALHVAAQENVDDSLAFLLANGADPNLRNSRGDTALHLAVQNGMQVQI